MDTSRGADIGVYGLGVMGAALARNFASRGFVVAVYNYEGAITEQFMAEFSSPHGDMQAMDGVGRAGRNASQASAEDPAREPVADKGGFLAAYSPEEFAALLTPPRIATVMVTAGDITDSVITELRTHCSPGDIIIDMGNSHYLDTRRRSAELATTGIEFIGCGTSGGQQGALLGPSLMVGGSAEAYGRIAPYFEAIAARAADGVPCCAHIGDDGAGHFVKMVHNGIEYADMALISEAYTLLRYALGFSPDEIAQIMAEFNRGELSSYLMECSAEVLAHRSGDVPFIDVIDDVAGQKGTGLWTAHTALDLGVAASTIIEATLSRFLSANAAGRAAALSAFSEPCAEKAGSLSEQEKAAAVEDIRRALYAGKIMAYSQGFELLAAGARRFNWDPDFSELARIWRAGCIIRADFLDEIAEIYAADPDLVLLASAPRFASRLQRYQQAWRRTCMRANESGLPAPVTSIALAAFDSLRAERMPTALIQGQRDYFGAHTYRRRDLQGIYHTCWEGPEREEIRLD